MYYIGIDGPETAFLPTATLDLSAIETYREISSGQCLTYRTPACACSARRLPGTRDTRSRIWSLEISCTELSKTASNHDEHARRQRVPCTVLQMYIILGAQEAFSNHLSSPMHHNFQKCLSDQIFIGNFDMDFSFLVNLDLF